MFWIHTLAVNGIGIDYHYDLDGFVTYAGELVLARDSQNGLITNTTLGSVNSSLTYNAFGELSGETLAGGTQGNISSNVDSYTVTEAAMNTLVPTLPRGNA